MITLVYDDKTKRCRSVKDAKNFVRRAIGKRKDYSAKIYHNDEAIAELNYNGSKRLSDILGLTGGTISPNAFEEYPIYQWSDEENDF